MSPNSILYPAIYIAIISIGAILTSANLVNTSAKIIKQATKSEANLVISDPKKLPKLSSLLDRGTIPVMTTTRPDLDYVSCEELINYYSAIDPEPSPKAYCLYKQNKLDERAERNDETMLLEAHILFCLGRMDACIEVYQKLRKSKLDSAPPMISLNSQLQKLQIKSGVDYFTLGDLCECYNEFSAYSVRTKVSLSSDSTANLYYVPFLSGIQI
ncbi:Peroxisomal OPC-8:0-CoA ligase 1 [Linum perenne]